MLCSNILHCRTIGALKVVDSDACREDLIVALQVCPWLDPHRSMLRFGSHIRLESLPKIPLFVQSKTTRALVRQLTCLLAYTEYQSHWAERPLWTQSPGSSAPACPPPRGANCPKCRYLPPSNPHPSRESPTPFLHFSICARLPAARTQRV